MGGRRVTTVAMPRHRAPGVRRAFRRAGLAVRRLWLHGYERGWDEAMGMAADNLEAALRQADGPYLAKADVKALALRLRREAEH
ncbi:hypothetical protein [Kribbella sp. CA-293567]|uniref:hypothetical protein n=1 Tax=Kribbella sp. CA-293567 TaxID=3002436 RepID=UPI0022DDDE30|nr:hypothetical protein [Kribbella sp. CA-293567]WBQ03833.1 hypothetical protein OX958_28165 [Kribbella sp. CA-293567]